MTSSRRAARAAAPARRAGGARDPGRRSSPRSVLASVALLRALYVAVPVVLPCSACSPSLLGPPGAASQPPAASARDAAGRAASHGSLAWAGLYVGVTGGAGARRLRRAPLGAVADGGTCAATLRGPCSRSATAFVRRACAGASTSPRPSSRPRSAGSTCARSRTSSSTLLPGADLRQGLPAHLRRVPRPRRTALRRRVQLALRRRGDEHEPRARRSAARPQRRHRRIETNVVLVALAAIAILMVIVSSRPGRRAAATTPRPRRRSTPADEARTRAGAAARRSPALRGSTHVTARVGQRVGERRVRRDDRARATRRARSAAAACGCRSTRRRTSGSRFAASSCTCPGRQPRVIIVTPDRLAPRVDAARAIVASGSELVRGDRNDRNGPYPRGVAARARHRPGADHRRRRRPGRPRGCARATGSRTTCSSSPAGSARRTTTARSSCSRRRPGRRSPSTRSWRGRIEARSRRVAERLEPALRRLRRRACASRRPLPAGARVGRARRHRAGGRAPARRDCVAVALPGAAAGAAGALAAGARDGSRCCGCCVRARPPERRVLRFFGVSESAVAQALGRRGRRRGRRRRHDLRARLRDPRRPLRRAGRGAAGRRARGRRCVAANERLSLLARRAHDRGARARAAARARA